MPTFVSLLDDMLDASKASVALWARVVVRHGALTWGEVVVRASGLRSAHHQALAAEASELQWYSIAQSQDLEPTTAMPLAYHLSAGGAGCFKPWPRALAHPIVPLGQDIVDAHLPAFRAVCWLGSEAKGASGLLLLAGSRPLGGGALGTASKLVPTLDAELPPLDPSKAWSGTALLQVRGDEVVWTNTHGQTALDDPETGKAILEVLKADNAPRFSPLPGAMLHRHTAGTTGPPTDDSLPEMVSMHPVRRPAFPRGLLLTPAERVVANDLAHGLRVTDIARAQRRAESTIESHRKGVYKRLGVANRVELVDQLRHV